MNNNFIVCRQGPEALTIVPTPDAKFLRSAIKRRKWEMSLNGRHCSSEYSWSYHPVKSPFQRSCVNEILSKDTLMTQSWHTILEFNLPA
jgi:hypothetical protein